jgi:c(7)-type cytochrome triheme protein
VKTWTYRGTLFLLCLAVPAQVPSRPAEQSEKVAASTPPGPAKMRLPPDLVFDKTVGLDQAVTFRHTTHVELADGKCVACHPEPFRILHPTRATSHEAMDAGGSCGACHDGKKAFATREETSCATCHQGAKP